MCGVSYLLGGRGGLPDIGCTSFSRLLLSVFTDIWEPGRADIVPGTCREATVAPALGMFSLPWEKKHRETLDAPYSDADC